MEVREKTEMSKENGAKTGASPKRAVVLYSVALFVVVVVFIAISYLINERGQDRVEALSEQQTTALQKIDTLRSENERLQLENDERNQRITELEAELAQTQLDWTEQSKEETDKHRTEYNALLGKYNDLLAQFVALKEEIITEEIEQ